MYISRFSLREKVTLWLMNLYFYIADVVEWSRALDIRLSDWCYSESMAWVQIPSREEKKNDSSNTVWFKVLTHGQETLRKRRSCPWVNICVAGPLIGWLWQIQIYIINHNPSWKVNERQKRESFWIRELQTLHLEGIKKRPKSFVF
jgi:hypothetical protein